MNERTFQRSFFCRRLCSARQCLFQETKPPISLREFSGVRHQARQCIEQKILIKTCSVLDNVVSWKLKRAKVCCWKPTGISVHSSASTITNL